MSERSPLTFSLPRLRFIRWLAAPGADVPHTIRAALVASLFEGLPIFVGGVLNTLLIALLCTLRVRSTAFAIWLGLELVLCIARTIVLVWSRRAAAAGRGTPTDLHFILGLCWSASIGYGTFLGLIEGDWVVATLTCFSTAGMVGGMCFRNFAAPRYVCAMILLSLGPSCPGALFSGEPILLAAFVQIPLFAYAMTVAAFRLNHILIETMQSSRHNAWRARRDTLTGLFNRDGLEDGFARALEGGDHHAEKLAVFYLDLDLFKEVNDHHGHAAGDQVLKAVADRLRRVLRQSDYAARIGGDEFVVMVRGIDTVQANRLAKRLVQEIAETPFRLPDGGTIRLGVSIGLAFAESLASETTLSELLATADSALYEAKANGRSQYKIARVAQAA